MADAAVPDLTRDVAPESDLFVAAPAEGRVQWLKWWGPAIIYALAIFICSSIGDLPSPPSVVTDKDVHGGLYAGLALLVMRAMVRGRWQEVTVASAARAALVATAYGVTDEFHQSFVPGRTADLRDLLADAVGAFAAALLLYAVGRCGLARWFADRPAPEKARPHS